MKKPKIPPADSIDELAHFWDTHDATDPEDELEKAGRLHPALKAAFSQLYGYTSDEEGIRHALLDESRVGFPEAKFMLVACSAFVSFASEWTSK